MEKQFRFGLKQRLFNWNMRVAREKMGLLQKDLGALVGVSGAMISHYETFRIFPPLFIQEKIAKILCVDIKSIFPEWVKEFKLTSTPKALEDKSFTLQEMISMKLINPNLIASALIVEGTEKEAEANDLKEHLRRALDGLSCREREILTLRFGLENGVEHTLEATGKKFGITGESIRRIQNKALRHIRHPSISRKFKNYWDGYLSE